MCGFVFVWLINLIPVVIGAMALGIPCFIYLQATQNSEPEGLALGLSLVAALVGGALGNWLRIVITVLSTAALGAVLLLKAVVKIHIEFGNLEGMLVRGDFSDLTWTGSAYAMVFVGLFASGAIVQFRRMARTKRVEASSKAESDEAPDFPVHGANEDLSPSDSVPARASHPEMVEAHSEPRARQQEAVVVSRAPICVLQGRTGDGRPVRMRISDVALAGEGAVIGRGVRNAAFVIDDNTVSRRHARLFIEAKAIHIEDLGSTNGTRVNGVPLEPEATMVARQGDSIEFGAARIKLTLIS